MTRTVLTLIALLVTAVASAQPVINPTKVEVTASLDHSLSALGVALVDSYRLTYKDGTTVLIVQDGGKPTPNASGKFDVAIPAGVLPVKNKNLTVTVEILGPGGVTAEAVSDFFGYLGPPRGGGKPLPKP